MIRLTNNENQQPQATTANAGTEIVKAAPKAKTQGIFSVTSRLTPKSEFEFIGSSSQAEICSRDYLSWCKKGKAPKKMQEEYDKATKMAGCKHGVVLDPTLVFKVEILEVCNTVSELEAAKERFGITRKAPTRLTTATAETVNPLADTEVAKLFAELAAAAQTADLIAHNAFVAQGSEFLSTDESANPIVATEIDDLFAELAEKAALADAEPATEVVALATEVTEFANAVAEGTSPFVKPTKSAKPASKGKSKK